MPQPLMRFSQAHAHGLPSLFPPVLPQMTAESLAAAANTYRQPAPPPQLPLLQMPGRHQEPFRPASTVMVFDESGSELTTAPPRGDKPSCPLHRRWPARGVHAGAEAARTTGFSDAELDSLVEDMAVLVRREFDCWVESCWTEAFHHVFTRTIPTFIIQLILAGASPVFMRRQIVHGGPPLDEIFMSDMLDHLYDELHRRLVGRLQPESRGESSAMASAAAAIGAGGLGAQANPASLLPRDGVCTHDLAPAHGLPADDDEHAACLCQLTSCLACLHAAVAARKAPVSLLPAEYGSTFAAARWAGGIETAEEAKGFAEGAKLGGPAPQKMDLPPGKGFVRRPKAGKGEGGRRPATIPHPQMTDVLAVEEHLRWRLKELGAVDPAVEARYGPSVNAAAALEGLERALKLDEDGSEASVSTDGKNGRRMAVGRSKARFNKAVKAPPKAKNAPVRKVYLPKEWAEAPPAERNMAIVLTFRHFVKLLHTVAMNNTPFAYTNYARDVAALDLVHPIALYRRLTESTAARRKGGRQWTECMDRWTEELGAREKAAGNVLINAGAHVEAVRAYSRAISLDGKKTVYYSNRAVALNLIGEHEAAEHDCYHMILKDCRNTKAFYQRAVARRGMGRWREAEADLRYILRIQAGNEAAKALLDKIKPELDKLPKQTHQDALNF